MFCFYILELLIGKIYIKCVKWQNSVMVLVTPSYDIFLLSILTMFKYINTRVLNTKS